MAPGNDRMRAFSDVEGGMKKQEGQKGQKTGNESSVQKYQQKSFRISEKEKKQIEEGAKHYGLSESEFIRRCIFSHGVKDVLPKNLELLMAQAEHEIYQTGIEISRYVREKHRKNPLEDPEKEDELMRKLDELEEILSQMPEAVRKAVREKDGGDEAPPD